MTCQVKNAKVNDQLNNEEKNLIWFSNISQI